MGIGRRSVSVWVAVLGLCLAVGAGAASAYEDTLSDGEINLGAASPFTVLTSSSDVIRGGSTVQGTVGIQSGSFNLSGGSTVTGDLVYDSGVMRNISGGSIVRGRTYQDNTTIDNALSDAQMLSDAAFAEAVTARYATLTSVNLNHSSLTITGGADEKIVLRLTDFVLTNNSIFTLSGTATTAFIVNVTNNFSLSSNSSISLLNVPASNVLFNILGTGSTVVLRGGSTMSGTLLALHRKVRIRGRSHFENGRVIANQVNMSRHANLLTPTRNQ
jgi:hypothetical protein